MRKGKPFFYRIDAADFFTIVNSFKSDRELGAFIRQFSCDLITKNGNSEYSKRVISEAVEYIDKKRQAGKKGGEQRASSAQAVLKQCYDSADSKSVASSSSSSSNSTVPETELNATTTRTRTELVFIESFDEKENQLRELFPQHDFVIVKEALLAHYRNQPPPLDPYSVIFKWFQRQQVNAPSFKPKDAFMDDDKFWAGLAAKG